MDLWPVLRFWPRRKNGHFSVPALRFASVVSQGHFFGYLDHLTEFHKKMKNKGTAQNWQNFAFRQISLKRCLYVKNWRKRFFLLQFWSQIGTPRYQNVIISPFLGHFLAKISFLGIYLWNGASISKVEESKMHFIFDFSPR